MFCMIDQKDSLYHTILFFSGMQKFSVLSFGVNEIDFIFRIKN